MSFIQFIFCGLLNKRKSDSPACCELLQKSLCKENKIYPSSTGFSIETIDYDFLISPRQNFIKAVTSCSFHQNSSGMETLKFMLENNLFNPTDLHLDSYVIEKLNEVIISCPKGGLKSLQFFKKLRCEWKLNKNFFTPKTRMILVLNSIQSNNYKFLQELRLKWNFDHEDAEDPMIEKALCRAKEEIIEEVTLFPFRTM